MCRMRAGRRRAFDERPERNRQRADVPGQVACVLRAPDTITEMELQNGENLIRHHAELFGGHFGIVHLLDPAAFGATPCASR